MQNGAVGRVGLSKMAQSQEQASQAHLARIQQLIGKVFLDPFHARQQVGDEEGREPRLPLNNQIQGRSRD
jgi:hypothetical protein